jgi:hypothetical protein
MIMGFFVSAKRYRVAEYVAVLLITTGIVLYSFSKVSMPSELYSPSISLFL